MPLAALAEVSVPAEERVVEVWAAVVGVWAAAWAVVVAAGEPVLEAQSQEELA